MFQFFIQYLSPGYFSFQEMYPGGKALENATQSPAHRTYEILYRWIIHRMERTGRFSQTFRK